MKPLAPLSDDELAALVHRALALPEAPASLLRTVIDQGPAPQPAPLQATFEAVRRRLLAVLSFDSWAAPMALGVRAVPSESRHLLFSASGRDIDLRVTPSARNFALTGQILGPDESGTVELIPDSAGEAGESRIATLDTLGEFRLDGVGRGTYTLMLRLGDDEVVLPPIHVGERNP